MNYQWFMGINRLLLLSGMNVLLAIFLANCSANEAELSLSQVHEIDVSAHSQTFGNVAQLLEFSDNSSTDTTIVMLNEKGNELLSLAFNSAGIKKVWNWRAADSTIFMVGEILLDKGKVVALNAPTNELYFWEISSGKLTRKLLVKTTLYNLALHGFSSDKGHLVTSAPISGKIGFKVQLFDSATGKRFSHFDVDHTAKYANDDAKIKLSLKPDVRLLEGKYLVSGSLHQFSNDVHSIYGLQKDSFISDAISFTVPEIFSDSMFYYRSHIYGGVSAALALENEHKILNASWPEPAVQTGIHRSVEELDSIPEKWAVAVYDKDWKERFWEEKMYNSPLKGSILSTNGVSRIWSIDIQHKNLIYQFKLNGL